MPVPSCQRRIVRARVSGLGGLGGLALPLASATMTSAGPPLRSKAIFHSAFWSVGQVIVVSAPVAKRLRGGEGLVDARLRASASGRARMRLARGPPARGGARFELAEDLGEADPRAGEADSIASGNRIQKPVI